MVILRRPSLYYPEITVGHVLDRTAKRIPNELAFAYPMKMTFKEFNVLSKKFATGLKNLRVNKGDRICVYSPNSIEFEIAYYGIVRAGAVLTPMNPMFKKMEVEFEAADSEAVGIVCSDELYPTVKRVIEDGKTKLKWVILIGKDQPNTYSFNELIKNDPTPPKYAYSVKEDLAVLAYTAGTTGRPKGVMLTHYNIVSNMLQNAVALGVHENDVCLTVLPLYHIYGLNIIMGVAVFVGVTQIVVPRFDVKQFCEFVERYKVSYINMVTPMFLYIADYLEKPETRAYDWSDLRFVNNGGAPIPRAIAERFERTAKEKCNCSVIVTHAWGLTEASPGVAINPFYKIKVESQGIPLSDTYHMIINPETGEELPIGERGELIVKGPQVMMGYWKRQPKEGFIVVKNEKWLRTGDLAYIDEEGYEHIVDRIKETIKYKGYTIAPFELEDMLMKNPVVADVAVIGKPQPVIGEIPKAFVVLRSGYKNKVKEEEIIDWIKERISAYKRIREVEFVDNLPRSPAGKLLRRQLKEQELKKIKKDI